MHSNAPYRPADRRRRMTAPMKVACCVFATAAAAALGSCGVTAPDEAPWANVADFSWSTHAGDSVGFEKTYSYNDGTHKVDTLVFDRKQLDIFHGAQAVSRLDLRNSSVNIDYVVSGDTMLIDGVLPAKLALIGPLQKGRSWDCTFGDTSATWHATVTNRYQYRNIGGNVYEDVLEMEYKPLTSPERDETHSWLCFFVKGMGLVEMRSNKVTKNAQAQNPNAVGEYERWLLITLPAGQNLQ